MTDATPYVWSDYRGHRRQIVQSERHQLRIFCFNRMVDGLFQYSRTNLGTQQATVYSTLISNPCFRCLTTRVLPKNGCLWLFYLEICLDIPLGDYRVIHFKNVVDVLCMMHRISWEDALIVIGWVIIRSTVLNVIVSSQQHRRSDS